MRIILSVGVVLVCGLAGFGWAKLVGCASGGCPLTATPWRGAAFGVVLGLILAVGWVPPAGTATDVPGTASDAIRHPGDAAAFAELVKQGSGRTVLVDFYATWCGPCQRLAPELATFAERRRDAVDTVKVDVDAHGDIAREYGVASVPTLCLFRDGKLVKKTVGFMSSEDLAAWVDGDR